MHGIVRIMVGAILALSLSGCQLLGALVPAIDDGASALPGSGTCAQYAVSMPGGQEPSPDAIDQMLAILGNRINATGVVDPVVFADEDQQIWIGLPGVPPEAVPSIRQLIGTTGVLEFMPVPTARQGSVGEGPLPEGMQDVKPLFTGTEIAGAAIAQEQASDAVVIDLQLSETGARLLDEWAADHMGQQFAIVLDKQVMLAPIFRATRFGGRVQISGGLGGLQPEEAQALLTILKFGSLPLEIREVSFGACETPGPMPSAGQGA